MWNFPMFLTFVRTNIFEKCLCSNREIHCPVCVGGGVDKYRYMYMRERGDGGEKVHLADNPTVKADFITCLTKIQRTVFKSRPLLIHSFTTFISSKRDILPSGEHFPHRPEWRGHCCCMPAVDYCRAALRILEKVL